MNDKKIKNTYISFGKLFLCFLLFFLLILFTISVETSAKITKENEDKTEENMASVLDSIISESSAENYVFNFFKEIINIARKKDVKEQDIANSIYNNCYKWNITAKFFFYNNNEFIYGFNYSNDDLKLFKNIFKYMSYDVRDPRFIIANRETINDLQKYFGPINQLESLKYHEGQLTVYFLKNSNQYYYLNNYNDGLSVFFYTLSIPDFINRFKIIKSKKSLKRMGVIDKNDEIIPPEGLSKEQTLSAFLKSKRTNKAFIEANDYYWYFQTTKELNKICYTIPINSKYIDYYNWANYVEKLCAILFIFVSILYVSALINFSPGKNLIAFLDNLSVKYRIIGIFSFASVFPLLIAFITGFALLSDKEKVIDEAILSESLAGLKNTENQYKVSVNKIIRCAEDLRNAIKDEPINEAKFYKYLEKHSLSLRFSRLEVRDENKKNLFTLDDQEINGVTQVIDLVSGITLKQHSPARLNNESLKISPGELVSEGVLSTDELGFASIIRQRGKLWTFKVGAFPSYWYWDVYPELATGPAFMCFTAQSFYIFSDHIKNYFETNHLSSDSLQIYSAINECLYEPEINPKKYNFLPKKQLLDIANTAYITNKVIFRTINFGDKQYWVTAKQEKNVGSHVFLHLINKKERLKVLEPFKWQIIAGGLFALIISLSGALFITRLVIIPIKDLGEGIEAIRYRYKDYTIPVRRKDEFGELASAFNRVIEELKDYDYGRVIQKSLLPSHSPEIEGYDIAFFTVSASDLAGDYHDCTILDDGRLSVLLGDVSGHGISASLAMAMAKAIFNFAKNRKAKFPEEFMDMLNTMFNRELKPRNKLMTLISIVLDPKTGEVIFDNAGQAYPAYYSESTQKSEELKMPSLPLGGMKKRKKKPIIKNMESGDAFILYSDGIIEASSASGEMFSYERFFATFTEQMKNKVSSKEAIDNIYQAVENFREPGHHSDDITMIIVKKI